MGSLYTLVGLAVAGIIFIVPKVGWNVWVGGGGGHHRLQSAAMSPGLRGAAVTAGPLGRLAVGLQDS